VYKLMYEVTREKVVVDLLALKYDYHNLKVLVKENALETNFEDLYVPIGSVDFERLKTDYTSGSLIDIDTRFREALEAVNEDFVENKDPQRIDLILDRYYFSHLYDLAKETEIPLFVEHVQDLIDFTNIKTLIRVKSQHKD